MKLGILNKLREAYFLAIGATLIEFFYTLLVVRFQLLLASNVTFSNYFQLITAGVLLVLGIHSLSSKSSIAKVKVHDRGGRKGFAKGVILGILNPLAIPFWLAVTSYLQGNGWVVLHGFGGWIYLLGVVLGSLTTLFLAARLGRVFSQLSDNRWLVNFLPGALFIAMAAWNFFQWFGR